MIFTLRAMSNTGHKPFPDALPRRIAETIFDRGALRPTELEGFDYPDGSGEISCSQEGDEIDGFMLSHIRGTTVVECLLEIAHVTRSVIIWPSVGPIRMAVTDRETIARLPFDFRADAGEIAVVSSVDDLWAAINREE